MRKWFKMKEWEDLSRQRQIFDIALCVVGFFTFVVGLACTDDLIEESERARIATEEVRMGAKKGTVRFTRAFSVVFYEFEYHWWYDKVILLVEMNGNLEPREYRLHTQVEIHKADTEFSYLKFEEKLVRGSNIRLFREKYNRLFWKRQMPPKGKVHLFLPI